MSYPAFLESPPWPRMPEGRKGELAAYYASGGPSLEANNRIPLLWQTMFEPQDIRQAYVIDDYDPEEDVVELEEYLKGTPIEAQTTYPYLVVQKEKALTRLKSRRERMLELLGERYRPIYDAFVDYVRTAYGPYILVRTSGLCDVQDSTDWITQMIEGVAALEDRTAPIYPNLAQNADELRRKRDEDAVPYAAGTGDHRHESCPWPSPGLVTAFPACAPKAPRLISAEALAKWDRKQLTQPTYRSDTALDKALEWVAAILFAASGIGAYGMTGSVWITLAAMAVTTVVTVWLLLRIKRRR